MSKILIIDDERSIRNTLKDILSYEDYQVSLAENGMEAIKMVGANEFDVILCDKKMPEMDGYEATTVIRREFGGGSLPIIAVSASAFEDTQQRALDAGCNAFISKPFKIENRLIKLSSEQEDSSKRQSSQDLLVPASSQLASTVEPV